MEDLHGVNEDDPHVQDASEDMLTDVSECKRDSCDMEDIYEVNEDVLRCLGVYGNQHTICAAIGSSQLSRKSFDDGSLKLLSISPPPPSSNFEYHVTNGR